MARRYMSIQNGLLVTNRELVQNIRVIICFDTCDLND